MSSNPVTNGTAAATIGSSGTGRSNLRQNRNTAGMKNDIAWNHDVAIDETRRKIKCKYCGKIVSGGVYRLKHHLAGTQKDVEACPTVPVEVKVQMWDVVASLQQKLVKKTQSAEFDEQINVIADSADEAGKRKISLDADSPTNLFKRKNSQTTINSIFKKSVREDACTDIASFFYNNAIPFNAVKSEEFLKMCASVARHGMGFKPPSYHEVRVTYLNKQVEATKLIVEEHKAIWKKTGCTIMTDGWTDRRRRTILNFLVNSPKGTIFLKSIDATDITKTADKVFKMMDEVVDEIGEENIVQVVTDNAANYKAADELLMQKRKHLYWTPCAAHCIDLMLEDFEKNIPLHKETIATDSDEKPAMGSIYEAMDQAKEKIQTGYTPLWEIIDKRWDKQLHRPLHAAGYYLNHGMHYSPTFKADFEVKEGMYECLKRMVGNRDERIKIDAQLEEFKSKAGMFGGELAICALKTKTPAQWWESYGDTCPELQRFAIRILSLTCSSSGCERNWSAFERVHTKKRNRLKQKTMNDVVFVMVNSRLDKKKQARKGKVYDIDDLASDDEWVADNVDENSDFDLDAPIEVGEEDANVSIGAALGDDLEIPNDNDNVEDEIDENGDHMEDDYAEFGLNNIIDI
ncbi:hypothetical protein TSUD_374840 [Trifolium subterraneum]|uniref:BED-type domain-containing protein n=1 Tax=Trifolium subterraneum TaxID=3900 RepID=A0A2Z6MXG5_TRISU|nr:hypothetical protein TSUD_374840 [Trifolium subterraneum]